MRLHEKRLAARYFLLSFAIGFLVLSVAAMTAVFFVPPKMSDGVTRGAGAAEIGSYLPTESDAFNVLLMLTGTDRNNDIFSLIRFDPVRGQVPVVVLPPETLTGSTGHLSTLNSLYEYAGIQNVASQIQDGMGVRVDRYVKLDGAGVVKLVDLLGGVHYRLGEPVKLKSTPAQPMLEPGEYQLSGNLFLELLEYDGYQGGESGRASAAAGLIAGAINEYGETVLSDEMDALFQRFVNIAATDISIVDYQGWISAGRFLARLDSTPAFTVSIQGERSGAFQAYTLSAATGRRIRELFSPQVEQAGAA